MILKGMWKKTVAVMLILKMTVNNIDLQSLVLGPC